MDQQKSQTKQSTIDNARISALVRSGAMSSSDLPRLKIALRRHSQVGDIAKLPKQHRDVLTRYYDATSSAAIGSQQAFQAVRRNLMQHNEIEGEEVLTEAISSFKDENNPPVMIVLQRKGIRIFPDGKKVAMYHNKQLGLVITIPYGGTGSTPGEVIPGTNIQMEEVESVEEGVATAQKVMDRANVVAKTNPDPKKRFAASGLAQKAMLRTINPTGVNTGITRGGGNKTYRKITGKAPPHQLTKKTRVSEEVEDIMESLEQVAAYAQQDNVTSHAKHFKFADGSKLKVSHGAAKAIHMVHSALNDENKKKFADMLSHPKGFEKAAHFALSKVKFSIGGDK